MQVIWLMQIIWALRVIWLSCYCESSSPEIHYIVYELSLGTLFAFSNQLSHRGLGWGWGDFT